MLASDYRNIRINSCFEVPGYEIDRVGKVFSFWKRSRKGDEHGAQWHVGTRRRPLSQFFSRDSHLLVGIHHNGRLYVRKVGCLVLESFRCSRPPGMSVKYLDGNKRNNALENLDWATHSEIIMHTRQFMIYPCIGECHPKAKLKNDDIPIIFEMRHSGETIRTIAVHFYVSESLIYRVLKREAWTHIPIPEVIS